MRYLCTIYTHTSPLGGNSGFVSTEPAFESPVASVVVSGSSLRQAAAQAYVRCIGRRRAHLLRHEARAPEEVIAQETSSKAIAQSLRKIARRIGDCFEMDNLVDAWSIKVEPAPTTSSLPQPIRLAAPLLFHLSRSSLPN